jgi:hypothetical protein
MPYESVEKKGSRNFV